MNGLILVHKPLRRTSHDIVLELRRALAESHVGHFGTLDPMATGVLVLGVGKGTRFAPFFVKQDKSYFSTLRMGVATETYDAEGRPVSEARRDLPDRSSIVRAIQAFRGEILQVPPPYSAKKHLGRPFYRLARSNQETPRQPCPVVIHSFELIQYRPPYADVEVCCSSGTYIRSLAHDLGQALGCGAHVTSLVRTRSGPFGLQDCLTLDEIKALAAKGRTKDILLPIESLLPEWPPAVLNEAGLIRAKNGGRIPLSAIEASLSREAACLDELVFREAAGVRLFEKSGRIVALARYDAQTQSFCPFLVIG